MLVAECPRCGRPTPARLASPDVLTCPACGWNGPPKADAAAHLSAARDALVNGDARARQMSAAKRRALTRNDGLVFALVFAACSVPSVAILGGMARDYARWHATSERRGGLVTGALVFAAMWLVGALALRSVRARQRALRAACAAAPPVRVGGAARCRLCGADLPATDAVTRCAYCGADNLADPTLTRSLDVGRGQDVARWREVLDADARILSRTTADANAVLFGAALLVPIAFAFAIGSLTVLLAKIERPVDDDARYVSVATRGGECVGRLPSDATLPIDFGKAFEATGQGRVGPSVPTMGAEALVGRHAHARVDDSGPTESDEVTGVVVRAHGSLVGNRLVLRRDGSAAEVDVDVRGVCVAAPSAVEEIAHAQRAMAVDAAAVYYADDEGVSALPVGAKDASAARRVATSGFVSALAIDRDHVYWIDGVAKRLLRAPKSGLAAGAAPEVVAPAAVANALAVAPAADGGLVAWIDAGAGEPSLVTVPKTGGASSRVKLHGGYVSALAVDGDDVYLATGNGVFRARGGSVAAIAPARCKGLAVFQRLVFCADDDLVTIEPETGHVRTVFAFEGDRAADAAEREGVAFDEASGTAIFPYGASNDAPSRLLAVPLAGGGPAHVVCEGLPRVSRLAVAAGSVWFLLNRSNVFGDDRVARCALPPAVTRR